MSADNDVKERRDMTRRNFLKKTGMVSGGIFLSTLPIMVLNTNMDKYGLGIGAIEDLNSLHTTLIPLDHSFRDAVTAKKISEYLVPKHKKDNEKVKVGIIYGALHSGIESKIKCPWVTDKTISLYQDGFDYLPSDHLNEVRELVRISNSIITLLHDSKLF